MIEASREIYSGFPVGLCPVMEASEKLLTLRFGPLTEVTRQSLQNADVQQLDRRAVNILTATSLEELLNG